MDELSSQHWRRMLVRDEAETWTGIGVEHAADSSAPAEPLPPADLWTAATLLGRAASLREQAAHGDGQASETLSSYPQHAAMLSFRAQDGVAELHQHFADLFVVLDGHATLITGGAVAGSHTVAPGEVRGASVQGGVRRALSAGDIAHIPAGVPHQLLIAAGVTFTSLVLKIQQD